MNSPIQLRRITSTFPIVIALLLVHFTAVAADSNTSLGEGALSDNTSGRFNTALGHNALHRNTAGNGNAAIGAGALFSNTTGGDNVAIGNTALRDNVLGESNTAIGSAALLGTNGSFNIALGHCAGISLVGLDKRNIDIGSNGVGGDSGTIRIGEAFFQKRTFIAGISSVMVAGAQVVVNAEGQLGVTVSSVRFKDGIKPMEVYDEAGNEQMRILPGT